jgi:hypothetical protein
MKVYENVVHELEHALFWSLTVTGRTSWCLPSFFLGSVTNINIENGNYAFESLFHHMYFYKPVTREKASAANFSSANFHNLSSSIRHSYTCQDL